MNNNNGQLIGADWEIFEEERREYQDMHTAWGRRNRGEIVTVKDYRLWKQRKRQLEREKDEY